LLLGKLEAEGRAGGRPRIYHSRCGNVKRLLEWVAFQLPQLEFTTDRAAVVRSDLMQMANALPVARTSDGRFQSKKGGSK
jgi:hypothetical protein